MTVATGAAARRSGSRWRAERSWSPRSPPCGCGAGVQDHRHPPPPRSPRRRSRSGTVPRWRRARAPSAQGNRESHDASDFYARFTPPKVSKDETVNACTRGRPADRAATRATCATSPDNSVALVVTSPPYFAGKEYEVALGEGGIPENYLEYLAMLRDVFAECVRVLEPGGRIARQRRQPRAQALPLARRRRHHDPAGRARAAAARRGRVGEGEGRRGLVRVRFVPEGVEPGAARSQRARRRRVEGPLRPRHLPEDAPGTRAARTSRRSPRRSSSSSTLDVWEMRPERARRVKHPAPFPVELPERFIQPLHLPSATSSSTRSSAPAPPPSLRRAPTAGTWATTPIPHTSRSPPRASRRKAEPDHTALDRPDVSHRAARGRTIVVSRLRVLAVDVTSNLYLLAAFGGGVISFLSPCVLPIVPGYLSLVTGLSVGEIQEQPSAHYLSASRSTRACSCSGSPWCSCCSALITTAAGSAMFRNQETLTTDLRRARAAHGCVPRGLAAPDDAAHVPGVPLPPAPRALRAGGGAGRGRRVRARLDAVHRPGPRRGARLRAAGARISGVRRSCSSPTRSASACRSSPSGSRWASSRGRSTGSSGTRARSPSCRRRSSRSSA